MKKYRVVELKYKGDNVVYYVQTKIDFFDTWSNYVPFETAEQAKAFVKSCVEEEQEHYDRITPISKKVIYSA